ncbi:hypothetical protein [Ensifer aridi]|uniref:hypothetical protein n=1 Tax=Ensifer aridi TaxID=1708715 RepID=UPI000A1204DA|nr:hypothetical protein [Ensifer aridi]
MQTRYLRLVCRTNDFDAPIYLDAPVETTAESSTINTKGVRCGFEGNIDGGMYPFILRKDKDNPGSPLAYLFDFGTQHGEPYRHYRTNLPSKNIGKATQFTVRWFDEDINKFIDTIYEIREVIDLLRQQPIDSL